MKQKYSQLETRYSAGISSSIPVEEPVITRTPRTTSTRHGSDDSLRNELLAKHALQAPSQTVARPSVSKFQAVCSVFFFFSFFVGLSVGDASFHSLSFFSFSTVQHW